MVQFSEDFCVHVHVFRAGIKQGISHYRENDRHMKAFQRIIISCVLRILVRFSTEPPSLSSAPQPRLQLPLDGAVATNNTLITCAASGSREYTLICVTMATLHVYVLHLYICSSTGGVVVT